MPAGGAGKPVARSPGVGKGLGAGRSFRRV